MPSRSYNIATFSKALELARLIIAQEYMEKFNPPDVATLSGSCLLGPSANSLIHAASEPSLTLALFQEDLVLSL